MPFDPSQPSEDVLSGGGVSATPPAFDPAKPSEDVQDTRIEAPKPLAFDQDKLGSLFQGPDKFDEALPEPARAGFQNALKTSTDAKRDRMHYANILFLSDRTGKPPAEIAQTYGLYRDAFSKQAFGGAVADEASFYTKAGALLGKEKDERGMLNQTAAHLYQQFVGGEPFDKTWGETHQSLETQPGFNPEHRDFYHTYADQVWKQYQAHAATVHSAVEAVKDYLSSVQNNDLLANVQPEKRAAAEAALGHVPPDDVDFVLGLATHQVASPAKAKPKEGVAEQLGRSVVRGAGEFVASGQAGVEELGLNLTHNIDEAFNERAARGGSGIAPVAIPDLGVGYRKINLGRRLDRAALGLNEPGKDSGWAMKQVDQAAQSIPRILSFFSGPGILLNFEAAKADALDNFQAKGIPLSKAMDMAAETASLDTVSAFLTGKLVAGSVPGLTKLVAGLTSASARIAATSALDAGAVGISMAVQTAAPDFVQAMTRHFDEAIPGVDWTERLKAYKDAAPSTILMMGMTALVAGGHATFKDPSFAKAFLSDRSAMKAYGFTDDVIRAMQDAHNTEQAEAILQNQRYEDLQHGAAQKEAVAELDQRVKPTEGEVPAPVVTKDSNEFSIQDQNGKVIAKTNSPEMAAKIIQFGENPLGDPGENLLARIEGMKTPKQKGALAKSIEEAQKLGAVSPVMETLGRWARQIADTAASVINYIRNVRDASGFGRILRDWVGAQQMDAIRITPVLKRIKEIAPDRAVREGIANWLDAGGNDNALRARLANTTDSKLKRGYEAALKLKPEELALAKEIRGWFDEQFQRAKAAGIMDDERFRQDYVTQLIDRPFVGGGVASQFYGKLNKKFQFAEARTFPNFGELEQAGFKVSSKDIGEIMAKYDFALSKSINTRRMMDALITAKNAEGDPLAFRGKPPEDSEITYDPIDHPTLRGIVFHPDISSHLKNILGQSAIREWYDQPGSPLAQLGKRGVKFVDEANRWAANTMLGGFSTFHLIHEEKRGLTYGINIFNLKPIEPSDPRVEQAVTSGLMLVHPNAGMAEFTEGVGGHRSGVDLIPGVRDLAKIVQDFTFKETIPRLKFSAWLALRERNMSWFSEELSSGKITPEQVDYLASQQVNARFGHLNMADIGRNPTIQHLFRFFALAPDFWEATLRNYGQQLKGLTLSKAGAEPLKGFIVTASVLWMGARVINTAVDDDHDPHFEEPFKVVYHGRTYSIRNEVQDAMNLAHGFIKPFERGGRNTYVTGRISPDAALAVNLISGSNWRGEKVVTSTALRDYLAAVTPISLRWIPGVSQLLKDVSPSERMQDVSTFQSFLQSQGIQIARKSAINEGYQLAHNWNDSLPKDDPRKKIETGAVYPVSPYQQIHYGLEDHDDEKVMGEIVGKVPALAKEVGAKSNPPDDLKAAALTKLASGAKSSILHAWTGSEANDEAFFNSLNEGDQHKVLTAQFVREAMYGRFLQLLTRYAKENKIDWEPKDFTPPKRDPYAEKRDEQGTIEQPKSRSQSTPATPPSIYQ